MRKLLSALAAACLLSGPALTGPAGAEGKSIIVLDASGSMWGQIDGRPKLEIAREALAEVLAGIPAETELGLMAYGHRSKGDCNDIELVVPPAAGTAGAISKAANEMKFLGKTPLSAAVRLAAEDLRYTEEKANVILITDGIETCEADPCALGKELEQSGIDFTAHVVGFGLTKEEGQAVACLAENTGGKYIEAGDASSLVDALKTTVVVVEPKPEPVPEPESAKVVLEYNVDPIIRLAPGQDEPELTEDATFEIFPVTAAGPAKDYTAKLYAYEKGQLPAGTYQIRAKLHEATGEVTFEAKKDELVQPEIILDAGILRLRVLASEGDEPHSEGYFKIVGPGGIETSGYAKETIVLPAREYALELQLGAAKSSRSFVIEAGQELVLDAILGSGLVAVKVTYDGNQLIDDGDLRVGILEAKADIAGNRNEVIGSWGNELNFDLAAGDYIALITLDGASVEVPVTVKTAERTDLDVNLKAGVAAFLGTGSNDLIRVLSATKDIAGNRKEFINGWGPDLQLVLGEGEYLAHIEGDIGELETPFTVKSGERVEIQVKN